jgi:hypothetical protein
MIATKPKMTSISFSTTKGNMQHHTYSTHPLFSHHHQVSMIHRVPTIDAAFFFFRRLSVKAELVGCNRRASGHLPLTFALEHVLSPLTVSSQFFLRRSPHQGHG